MKINTNNIEAVQAAMHQLGRPIHNSFTAEHIGSITASLEEYLTHRSIPKRLWRGMLVIQTYPGPSANSYKYSKRADCITLQRGSASWYLIHAYRDTVYPKQLDYSHIEFTLAAQEEISKRLLAQLSDYQ